MDQPDLCNACGHVHGVGTTCPICSHIRKENSNNVVYQPGPTNVTAMAHSLLSQGPEYRDIAGKFASTCGSGRSASTLCKKDFINSLKPSEMDRFLTKTIDSLVANNNDLYRKLYYERIRPKLSEYWLNYFQQQCNETSQQQCKEKQTVIMGAMDRTYDAPRVIIPAMMSMRGYDMSKVMDDIKRILINELLGVDNVNGGRGKRSHKKRSHKKRSHKKRSHKKRSYKKRTLRK